MNTILLLCPRDSFVVDLCRKGFENLSAESNWADVSIAQDICKYIFCIVLVLAITFLLWRFMDHIANGISGLVKRMWEVKDKQRKQASDILDKYIDHLKENASIDCKYIKREDYFSLCNSLYNDVIDIINPITTNENRNNKIYTLLRKLNEKIKKGQEIVIEQVENKNSEDYLHTLAYLIEKLQKGKLDKIETDTLLKALKEKDFCINKSSENEK